MILVNCSLKTIHAEQCAVSNMYLHTSKDGKDAVDILAGKGILKLSSIVTETPCGHCRQILQELLHAKDVRVIVKSQGMDCKLGSLLPYSYTLMIIIILRFELPVNGIVHHFFEKERITDLNVLLKSVSPLAERILGEQKRCKLNKDQWTQVANYSFDEIDIDRSDESLFREFRLLLWEWICSHLCL